MRSGQAVSSGEEQRVFIKSYGCQMNVYDADRMGELLASHGYRAVDTPDAADLVILNTCHIREKAAEKVYSEIGRLRSMNAERKGSGRAAATLAVAGCVAQAEGEAMLSRAPAIDLIVGPQTYHRLPALLDRVAKGERGVVDTDFPETTKFKHLPKRAQQPLTAFLTVQEGCDKFCTFCVVPYTRGAEVSRPVAEIVAEAQRLVRTGARELTLLGQNVNAYHGTDETGKEVGLAALCYRLASIEGLERLRYTTSHPRDMSDDLIAAHRDLPELMPYLHLPVQAGSDRILKKMNRQHTAENYLRLIEQIRKARPDIALSSDFIVGFPGETDEDFEATLALIRQVGFAQSFSFKYSPRPGTPAADMPPVDEAVSAARLQILQALLREQQQRFAAQLVGRTLPVLFEKAGRHAGQLAGRSPYLHPVQAEAPESLIGQIADVAILEAVSNSLTGALAAQRAEPRRAFA
ncbi:MAG: tRNA (N6-isopentenyl adenosine(37)-C2)-methylthiotransferase MiaB [Pseudomonadota bacterium]